VAVVLTEAVPVPVVVMVVVMRWRLMTPDPTRQSQRLSITVAEVCFLPFFLGKETHPNVPIASGEMGKKEMRSNADNRNRAIIPALALSVAGPISGANFIPRERANEVDD
jgi:hypothetical protein